MRVTGGILRGRTIRVPTGNVRPTQDMVREALFSIIAEIIPGSRFLDLFGGSGAVGIEAWSRGAEYVEWVEFGKRVFPVIKSNVESLCESEGKLTRADAVKYLARNPASKPFDIIFADPPYGIRQKNGEKKIADKLMDALKTSRIMAADGLFIIEQSVEDSLEVPLGFDVVKEKTYGGSRLSFIRKRYKGEE